MKTSQASSQLERIRSLLCVNLPWSQHDYIPGINLERDKEVYANELTHPLPDQDDLRFIAAEGESIEYSIFAQRLPWDSQFFGIEIARLDGIFPLNSNINQREADYSPLIRLLLDQACERGIHQIFTQVDPRDLALLRSLGELGFSVIETRVYYYLPLANYQYGERYSVRAASTEDVPTLAKVSRDMVNPYDRFHADPLLDHDRVDRLMERWVEASILEGFADITLVPDCPEPKAFCTVKYHRNKWEDWGMRLSQPVFSAVSSEFRGWYRKLISEVIYHLRDYGAEYIFISTQATNRAVIRVWESLGIRYGKASLVLRKQI